jgi:predicted metal-dependent phosphoesterase TrpH
MTAPSSDRFVDLHAHSTASDGAFPPREFIAYAQTAKLLAVALTDHDTLAGLPEAREAGAVAGIEVIAGVELSAVDGDRETHLLGLHLVDVDGLDARLADFRATRITRAEEIVRRLNALGVPVTTDAVLAEAADGAVGRPHVARAIIKGGWVRDNREAFDRYLGSGRPAFVQKHQLSLADAIRLVHDAGGVAVYAHPGSEGNRERIEPMVALGLDGVEVKHPSHSADDVARLGALTDYFGMVPSGGSDWHGATGGPRVLGNQKVPAAWMDRQRERAARYASAGA